MNAISADRSGAAKEAGPWRRESSALFKLALPLVMTELSQMSMGLTDTLMMGWLGAEQLAAGALANHFYGLFVLIGIGVTSAVAPLVAQAIGARQFRIVRRSVRQGFWAAAIIALPGLAIVWQAEAILIFLGQDPAVAANSQAYLRVMVWGFLPILWYLVLSHFLAAHGRPRAALVVSLIAIAVNAAGNTVFMFGYLGFPALGLVGAGLSTLVVDCFMFLALLAFVLNDRRLRRYRLLGRIWRPDWARLLEIFRIGVPIALALLAEIGLFLASSLLIGRFGTDQLAAHGLATETVAVLYMVPYGIGQAAAVRVGWAAGRDDPVGIGRAGYTALFWGCSFAVLPAFLFWFFGFEIVSLFLDPTRPDNAAAVAFAVGFLKIAAFFQLVDAGQVVAAGALRGLKDTRVPMLFAILGYWVFGFTGAWLFAVEFGYEGTGAWIGLAIGLSVAAPLMILRFRSLVGRGLRQEEGKAC